MSELSYNIKFEDNSKIVLETEKEAVDRALYAIGVKAVEGATDAISGKYNVAAAVDTGRLRASISFVTNTYQSGQVTAQTPKIGTPPDYVKKNPLQQGDLLSGNAEKNSVIVGSNVEYAEKVHNGDSKMKSRPFLREGIDRTKDDMQRQVEKIFKGQL